MSSLDHDDLLNSVEENIYNFIKKYSDFYVVFKKEKVQEAFRQEDKEHKPVVHCQYLDTVTTYKGRVSKEVYAEKVKFIYAFFIIVDEDLESHRDRKRYLNTLSMRLKKVFNRKKKELSFLDDFEISYPKGDPIETNEGLYVNKHEASFEVITPMR